MQTIHYNKDGWVCERFPYDIKIDNENRYIEVDEDQYHKTFSVDQDFSWRVVNGKLVVERYQETPIKNLLGPEREAILQWLSDNDYIINKVFLQEWSDTDPRFISYKAQRQLKRNRLDEIDAILMQM